MTHLGAHRRDPGRASYSSTRRWAARSRRYGCAVAGAGHLERMERRDVAGCRGCVIGGVPTRTAKETEHDRRRTRASSGHAGRCRGIVQSRGGVFKVLKGAWSPQSGGRPAETNWHGARRLEGRTSLTGICLELSSPHCHEAFRGLFDAVLARCWTCTFAHFLLIRTVADAVSLIRTSSQKQA